MTSTSNARPKFNPEQEQAIMTEGQNILVSASAGSGKTMVLVERILKKVQQNITSVSELIVVTFTEMAAKEMKERLEDKLKKLVSETSNPDLQRKWLKEIESLPQAHIQTLHSFCLFVLKNYFHVIDIDPNFALITDEVVIHNIYQEAWGNVCNKIFNEQLSLSKKDYESLLNQYSNNISDQAVYDMVLSIYNYSRSHPESELWLDHLSDVSENPERLFQLDLYDRYIIGRLRTSINLALYQLDKAWKIAEKFHEKNQEKYQTVLEMDKAAIEKFQSLLSEAKFQKLSDYWQNINFKSWPPNRSSSNPDDYELINEAKKFREEALDPLKKFLTDLFKFSEETYLEIESKNALNIQKLSVLVKQFSSEIQDIKSRLNVLDYNDLEHLTLDILAPINPVTHKREGSDISREFQENFHEILIDEYQDINEIQASILHWLSRQSHPSLANNLFMVGDVKQSIYGFRMAEPSLFLEKYKGYQQSKDDALIILDQNYRSKNEVLQFTNFIFERIMDHEFGNMSYGAKEALKFGNLSLETGKEQGHFQIEILVHDKNSLEESEELDKSLEAEAHIIAQKIQALIKQPFMIFDKKYKGEGNPYRPISYKDIVILTATRKPFLTIQQVFQKYGLPIFTQKIENYYQRYEIQLVLAVLKIIDNPFQDIPLVAVLRSFIVGLTDDDLAQIRISNKNGNYYQAVLHYVNHMQEQDDKIDKKWHIFDKLKYFLTKMNEWRQMSLQISVMDLILKIYDDTQILNHFALMTNSDQRLANLHGLYEQAKDFETDGYQGVFAFTKYISEMLENDKDIAEPIVLSENQDYVRLMTVHSSKGLEFPLVFLMDTGKQFNLQDSQSKFIAHRQYGIATKIFDKSINRSFKPLSYDLYREDLKDRLKAEEMRKLYVALTRCEQKLIIVGTVSSQEASQEWIQQAKETSFAHDDSHDQGGNLLVNIQMRQQSKSWLDWILASLGIWDNHGLSITKDFSRDNIHLQYIKSEDISSNIPKESIHSQTQVSQSLQMRDQLIELLEKPTQESKVIQEQYHWKSTYPFQLATRTSSYQSVSELKRMYEEPVNPKLSHFADRRENVSTTNSEISKSEIPNTEIQAIRYTQDTFNPPRFIEEVKGNDAIRKGNANHLLMQHIDFANLKRLASNAYSSYLTQLVEELQSESILSPGDAKLVDIDKIITFLKSDLGSLIQTHHHHVMKEQPFSYRLPASEIFDEIVSESLKTELGSDYLLIHGVIDNYILTDNEIYLIDYKTDRYKSYIHLDKEQQIQAIMTKYYFQLQLYANALKSIYPEKQVHAYIVLLDFETSVKINIQG